MKKISTQLAAFCIGAGFLSMAARADQLPLWELGAGPAAISFPQYRGSDQRTNYVLPAPYLVYRGEFLKADRQRVRGLFFKSDRMEVDVSTSGSVPVKSKDNRARTGMPDLDPTVEIGPALNLSLDHSADNRRTLEIRLPLRAVISTDFRHVGYQGWLFQPQLNWDNADFMGVHGLNLGLVVGPVFGSAKYHQYFYNVDPAFATAGRPAYQAHGGYGGTQFIGAMSRRFSDFWVGGFMKYDHLRGAAFDDSPLTKSKSGFSAGIAVLWVFAESKTKVDAVR
jgi:outer membrane scaffolding protein for murein synthesis (MipA/OmpV family)